jgi:integrase
MTPAPKPPVAVERPEPEQLRLFEGGIDMGELRRERAAIAGERRAASTLRAYASDWADWEAWCERAGRRPLPATADALTLYLVDLARVGRSVPTLERRCVAITGRHAAAGKASPVTADVREVLAGLARRVGRAPRCQKLALAVDDLVRMLAACPEGARGARDRAALLIGFGAGFRRSELCGLDLADVSVRKEGLLLRLRRGKTDQEGRGREVGVHRGRRVATCPVRALEAWLRERGRWPGPLFVRIMADGAVTHERLRGGAVAELVKAAARRVGLDAARYSGHSLRAGFATAAAERGASDRDIMARTGHRSAADRKSVV